MWTRTLSTTLSAAAAAAWIVLLSDWALAQAIEPSASRGRELAVRLCSNCHLVDGSGTAATPVGIGTFRGIANRPGQTADRISNVLILPHMPMPDAQLTREEIRDILAYLETLRTNPDVPPLMAPGSAKPQYPSKT
jgi:cytochrome c